MDKDGKLLYSIDNYAVDLGEYSGIPIITTLHNDVLFFGRSSEAEAYDFKAKDLIWNEDGTKTKKSYNLAEGSVEAFTNVENGIYTISFENGEYLVGYTILNKKQASIVSSIALPSELNIEKTFISLNDENVNVYTLVDYKGKATLQKYIIPRIDM
ncbi:hypothetical protein [Peribacillus frigoritolerans]|uniref:hypothetical protein n=1 Tax=Peribacillus frigoritolerans TaxID=450367 RepID=UPI00330592B7